MQYSDSKEENSELVNGLSQLEINRDAKDSGENLMSSQLLAEAVMESTQSGIVEYSETKSTLFASNIFYNKCKNRFLIKSFLVLNYFCYNLFLNYLSNGENSELISDYKVFGAVVFLILTTIALYDEINLRLKIIFSSLKSREFLKAEDSSSQGSILNFFSKKIPFILEITALVIFALFCVYSLYQTPYLVLENFLFIELLFLTTVFSFSLYIDVLIYKKADSLSYFKLDTKLLCIDDGEDLYADNLANLNKTKKEASLVKVNDLIVLKPGVVIPLDVEVVRGSAYVNQFTYNIESEEVVKAEGSFIRAGSKILSGTIIVRATSTFFESELSFFTDHIKELQTTANTNSKQNKKQATLVNWYYTLLTFVIATASIFWYQNGASSQFIINLIVSALCLNFLPKIFTFTDYEEQILPIAFFKKGLIYLNTEFWLNLSQLKKVFIKDEPSVLFDLVKVTDFVVIDERVDFDKFLPIIAKLILMSDVPEASAFARYFKEKNIVPDLSSHQEFYFEPGKGIEVNMHGVKIIYGTEEFLLSNNVKIQSMDIDENHALADKKFIAIESLPVAYFVFKEIPTSQKSHFINQIRASKVDYKILTQLKDKQIKNKSNELALELKDFKNCKNVSSLVELTNSTHNEVSVSAFYPLTKGESYHIDNFSNLNVMGMFDAVEYNLYNFDATLIKQNLSVVPNSISLAKKIVKARQFTNTIFYLSTLSLIALICIVSPASWIIASVVAGLLVVSYSYRLMQF